MAPEGMVHALKLVHSLLKPGGMLIDIHPCGQAPLLQVSLSGRLHPAGVLQETDGFVEYAQAANALAHAAQNGWFGVETSTQFTYILHAETPSDLFEFLNAEWKDAVIAPDVSRYIEELYQSHSGDREVRLVETVTISRLRALPA